MTSRLNYPTGAEVRAWAGAITTSSFRVNADFTQTVEAVSLAVSLNSDMSNPFYRSAYQTPAVTTGVAATYHTCAFDVPGLSPATKYYWQLNYLDAKTQGGTIRSCSTTPSGAAAFLVAFGSCADLYTTNTTGLKDTQVFRAIAAENPLLFIHLGDMTYSNVTSLVFAQRDLNARAFCSSPDASAMLQTVPIAYITSDHDYASNDCSLDTANSATIFPQTRQVFAETVPAYPFPIAGLLTQIVNIGLTRFILLDAYGAATYTGNTALGAVQLAWLGAQLAQAAADGVKWVFIGQGRTWTGGSNHGFPDSFVVERQAICDMIEAATVPVCLIVGDVHACAFDDGANTALSANGFAKFPQLVSSGLYQLPSSSSGPYTWNSVAKHFSSFTRSAYMTLALSADNTSWTATVKSDPINGSFVPTTVGSVVSTDVVRAVSFNNATPSVARNATLTVNLDVTWFGAASVAWSGNGQSGVLALKPNSTRTSFTILAPATAGSFQITLSSPSGCTISGTNPATVTVT